MPRQAAVGIDYPSKMSQVSTPRAGAVQVRSTASTGCVVGWADPVAGSSVMATPSPAPSGTVSDKVNTSPRSVVPAGTATGPDVPGFSTHASQAFPVGGGGRRTIRYGDPGVGITTAARASGCAPVGWG